jgi:hypothetical protein
MRFRSRRHSSTMAAPVARVDTACGLASALSSLRGLEPPTFPVRFIRGQRSRHWFELRIGASSVRTYRSSSYIVARR